MRIRHQTSPLLLAALTLLAGSTASSCTSGAVSAVATLTILTPWTDRNEALAFSDVVGAFEHDNPTIHVDVQPTRSLAGALESDVQQGSTPDLAIMPNPGALRTYVASGVLVPLNKVNGLTATLGNGYNAQWLRLMNAGTSHPYAVPVKVSVKSLIWYDREALSPPHVSTWQDLSALSASITTRGAAPWCLALADPPSSGWPGTDWIEDILLHQAGPTFYAGWIQGQKVWTSSQVESAWRAFGQIIASGQVYGSAPTALLTSYSEADYPMFTESGRPGCYLNHGALLTTDPKLSPKPKPGIDYDFFTFPSLGASGGPAYEVAGDMMGMFHDSAAAEQFITFMAGAKAQIIWPKDQPEEAFTANKQAEHMLGGNTSYESDSVAKKINELLKSDATLCFDASDLMPDAMTNAFYRAVLEYVQDPTQLGTILANLEKVRGGAYPPGGISGQQYACGP